MADVSFVIKHKGDRSSRQRHLCTALRSRSFILAVINRPYIVDVFYLPSPAESYIIVECATAKSNYNSSISYGRSPSAEIVEDEIDRSNLAERFTIFAPLACEIEFFFFSGSQTRGTSDLRAGIILVCLTITEAQFITRYCYSIHNVCSGSHWR